jgi:hypothetical protein
MQYQICSIKYILINNINIFKIEIINNINIYYAFF